MRRERDRGKKSERERRIGIENDPIVRVSYKSSIFRESKIM